MSNANIRCEDCDLTLATEWELNNHPENCPCCELLCWRIVNTYCQNPQVNWRERALSFERAAQHWARAYMRETKRRDMDLGDE